MNQSAREISTLGLPCIEEEELPEPLAPGLLEEESVCDILIAPTVVETVVAAGLLPCQSISNILSPLKPWGILLARRDRGTAGSARSRTYAESLTSFRVTLGGSLFV